MRSLVHSFAYRGGWRFFLIQASLLGFLLQSGCRSWRVAAQSLTALGLWKCATRFDYDVSCLVSLGLQGKQWGVSFPFSLSFSFIVIAGFVFAYSFGNEFGRLIFEFALFGGMTLFLGVSPENWVRWLL